MIWYIRVVLWGGGGYALFRDYDEINQMYKRRLGNLADSSWNVGAQLNHSVVVF